jgi:hypothetical protein
VGRCSQLDVLQVVEYVKQEAKMVYLLECLQKTPPPVIIFSETKNEVDGKNIPPPNRATHFISNVLFQIFRNICS